MHGAHKLAPGYKPTMQDRMRDKMSSNDSSGFPWFLIFGGWFAFGLCSSEGTAELTVTNKPVAAQVAAAPADPEPNMSEPDSWDPDKVLYAEGVTDADELFQDTFAAVKDPFEKNSD